MPDTPPDSPQAHGLRRGLAVAAGNVVLAAVYLGVAKLSLAAATEHRVVSSIWPPAGIALFALLRYGTSLWPGVAVGAFLLNFTGGISPGWAAVIGFGDAVEAIIGARFVHGMLGHRRSLSRVRDVAALALLGGALPTMIAATVGVGTLLASGSTTLASAGSLWLVWWTGDALGVLVVTPFLLVWTATEMTPPVRQWRWLEAGGLFLALALMSDYLFSHAGVLAFAIYPLALLISWRLGPRAAATATVVVTLIASFRTLAGYGPFTAFTPTANLFALQLFLALLAVKNLLFAAAHTEGLYSEARLAASESRYRMLAQHLPDGAVVLYDRSLTLLLVEGPAVATAGFVQRELLGKRITDVFGAEHGRTLVESFGVAFAGKEQEFEFAYRDRLYLLRVLPVTSHEGEPPLGMALALDVTDRSRAQREVAESRAQLEQLSRLLLTAQEDERRRVAREVHDELGQALTAVKIGLARTLNRAQRRNSLESERRARNASDVLDRAIESVQRIVLRLRPGVLDNLGPLAALEHEVQQFRETTNVGVTLVLPNDVPGMTGEQSTVLYRTVQEALTNVVRHAQAKRVLVSLDATGPEFVLQVADDGVGIAEEQLRKPRSMGLLGMRERAAACGGRVDITRLDTGGTCVTLRIPRDVMTAPKLVLL